MCFASQQEERERDQRETELRHQQTTEKDRSFETTKKTIKLKMNIKLKESKENKNYLPLILRFVCSFLLKEINREREKQPEKKTLVCVTFLCFLYDSLLSSVSTQLTR